MFYITNKKMCRACTFVVRLASTFLYIFVRLKRLLKEIAWTEEALKIWISFLFHSDSPSCLLHINNLLFLTHHQHKNSGERHKFKILFPHWYCSQKNILNNILSQNKKQSKDNIWCNDVIYKKYCDIIYLKIQKKTLRTPSN